MNQTKPIFKFGQIRQIIKNTKRLFVFAWRMDPRITFLYYLTAAIGAMVPVASAFALKLLIDNLQLTQGSMVATVPAILVLILSARYVVTLFDGVIYGGVHRSYLDYVFRYKLQNEITMQFHKKISKLDIAYFENAEVQDLITKTRDTMQWRLPDYLRTFSEFFRDIISFVIAFVVLIPFGWWIPVAISLISLPRLFLQARYGATQWSIWGSGAPQTKKLWYFNRLLQEPMTVRETRISQSSEHLLEKFQSVQQYLFNLSKGVLDKYLRVLTIPPIIEAILIFFIAYHFLPSVVFGALTVGSFTLLISMVEQLGGRAAGASIFFALLYENSLYVNHYFDFLALPPYIKTSNKPIILDELKPPRIEFKEVSFNYPNGPKVLDKVSFVVEPGESIALVGHNGAGKTTIVKLLCRFYDVTDGEILINGINIKELDISRWYKFMGTLFQEFVKYHFSVKENIFLGAPDKKDEQAMRDAAIKSGAAEFIEKLPNKYDQILGKEFGEGEELSGGQWQKLAIARAFYEEPPVLILDEPTSAIDAEAEQEIFNNLERQYKNKTLILISHRFSTVRNANKIVVIDDGKIVETGTHKELMELNGQYSKLFLIQAKGYN